MCTKRWFQWRLDRVTIPSGTGTHIARFDWALTFNGNALFGIAKVISRPLVEIQHDWSTTMHGVFLKQEANNDLETTISAIAIGH